MLLCRAKLGAAQRQSQSLRGDVRAATERADAYMQELTAKDAQMGTLRQRISELEVQASTEGGDVGGDDFEAALREEMDSMRASYTAVWCAVRHVCAVWVCLVT